MDGCPLGLGLVVEDKPTEFSYMYICTTLLGTIELYGSHSPIGSISEVYALFISCDCVPSEAVSPWQALSTTPL